MAIQTLDTRGLKCPQPTLKITTTVIKIPKGEILEVTADCDAFEKDVRDWCQRNKKVLLWVRDLGGGAKSCQIQL